MTMLMMLLSVHLIHCWMQIQHPVTNNSQTKPTNLNCKSTTNGKADSNSYGNWRTHKWLLTIPYFLGIPYSGISVPCPGLSLPGMQNVPYFRYSHTLACLLHNTHTTVLLLFWNMSGTTRVSRYQKGKTRKVKTTQFFTGRMPFLPPNQQCQSTEGKCLLHKFTLNSNAIIVR